MKRLLLVVLLSTIRVVVFSAASAQNDVTAQRPIVDLQALDIKWSESTCRSMLRGVPADRIPSYTKSIVKPLARIIQRALVVYQSGVKMSSEQVQSCCALRENLFLSAMLTIHEIVGGLWDNEFKVLLGEARKKEYLTLVDSCVELIPATVFEFRNHEEAYCTKELRRLLTGLLRCKVSDYQEQVSVVSRQRLDVVAAQKHQELLLIRQREVKKLAEHHKTMFAQLQSWSDRSHNDFCKSAQQDVDALSLKLEERATLAASIRCMLIDSTMGCINRKEFEDRERNRAIEHQIREREMAEMIAANQRLAVKRQQAAVRADLQRYQSYSKDVLSKHRLYLAQLGNQMTAELPAVLQKTIDRQRTELAQKDEEVQTVRAQRQATQEEHQDTCRKFEIAQQDTLRSRRQLHAAQQEGRGLLRQLGVAQTRCRALQRDRDFAQHQVLVYSEELRRTHARLLEAQQFVEQRFDVICPRCLNNFCVHHCTQACCAGNLVAARDQSSSVPDVLPGQQALVVAAGVGQNVSGRYTHNPYALK